MVSMVISCFPGNGHPGLTTFLLLYYILNLTHQRVHVDQEEGGCEGVCVCVRPFHKMLALFLAL